MSRTYEIRLRFDGAKYHDFYLYETRGAEAAHALFSTVLSALSRLFPSSSLYSELRGKDVNPIPVYIYCSLLDKELETGEASGLKESILRVAWFDGQERLEKFRESLHKKVSKFTHLLKTTKDDKGDTR